MNISQYELSVLKAFDGLGDYGKTLDQISADAEIPRVKIRRFVRSLARKDMLELLPWYDDYTGFMNGSGYSLTTTGQKYLDSLAASENENDVQG